MVDQVKVMIGVTTAGMIRHAQWIDHFHQIIKPEGTLTGFIHGASPARGRNDIIKAAIAQEMTHILFIDDDTIPPPDVLQKLLPHDKDIVGGLYLMRSYPHYPLMFQRSYSDGRCLYKFLTPDTDGLVEVVNTGLGCCLIKTDVFKKMPHPWITLGETEKDHWGDDISFFNRAVNKYDYKVFVDTTVRCGHITNSILIPFKLDDGSWVTQMNTGSNHGIHIPQAIPDITKFDDNGELKAEYREQDS
jgi:hypothetical protein